MSCEGPIEAAGAEVSGSAREELAMREGLDRDAALVEALRRNDSGGAEAFIATYGDRAYRLAISITGNRSDAEEVVQDAVWTVIQKIDTFRGEAAFSSWVYRVVANRAYEKLRRGRTRRLEYSLDDVEGILDERRSSTYDWSADLEDPALQADLRRLLTEVVNALPERYRTVIVLRDVEGLSVRETSEIMGIGIGNVKARTHRARLVLRRRLSEYFADRSVSVPAQSTLSRVQLGHRNRVDDTWNQSDAFAGFAGAMAETPTTRSGRSRGTPLPSSAGSRPRNRNAEENPITAAL
jgi:RNA polymerase sigma-70 factor (ECF subfamily)